MARAGTSPALNSRWGVRRVEADRVARAGAGTRRSRSGPSASRSGRSPTPGRSAAGTRRPGSTRRRPRTSRGGSRRSGSTRSSGAPRRPPIRAGCSIATRLAAPDRAAASSRTARSARPRLGPGHGRLGVHEEQRVQRDPQLVREGVQRVDRRLRSPGLDLRDQARRDAEHLGEPRRLRPTRRAAPGAGGRPSSRTRAPSSRFAAHGPTPPPARCLFPPCYPWFTRSRVAPTRRLCSISERYARPLIRRRRPRRRLRERRRSREPLRRPPARPFASPGAQTVDWEERVNPDRLRTYRLGRAKAALAASRRRAPCSSSTSTTSATSRAPTSASGPATR